ncbi:DUF938 domain-containing protein [Salinimonas sp. HHU 13199]|uniref:DUF938 domain-containing protein n=1 Tax=Salinimonas profundi TaxID=2729140 RepID=A0ABR8LGB5_9ALTE|nr:DUF938 domain-containing protein [Salinimonas profundi]MBD3585299.1 DUF938 domain-containing protein [Salinimonas profundi]
MTQPYSQACENNKRPILEILATAFARCQVVLEIGSGTGQHAVFFAGQLPFLQWHTSDQPHYHAGINSWIDLYPGENLHRPVSLTIGAEPLPALHADGIFTANTAHIMQKAEVQLMMEQVASMLPDGGVFCQYGPFTQNGRFNSDSNEAFHYKLVTQGYGGYRDIEELQHWASPLHLKTVHPMPANNLLLEWHKQ